MGQKQFRQTCLPLYTFKPGGLFYLNSLDRSISNRRDVGLFLVLPCFIEIPVLNANSVDLDQTPRSAASDLGLHCWPVSLLWDAKHNWVKLFGSHLMSHQRTFILESCCIVCAFFSKDSVVGGHVAFIVPQSIIFF